MRRFRSRKITTNWLKDHLDTKLNENSFEKYSALAKEAMSAGDKTLSENYLQHADHFMRMIEDKNRNRNLAKDNTFNNNKSSEENKSISDVNNTNDKEEIKNKD